VSETNVAELFAERTSDTEVAANFAYLNGIAPVQVEQVVPESTATLESAHVAQEAALNTREVLNYATTIGGNLEGLRRAA